MFCDVAEIMTKDEQYARGWTRLFNTTANEDTLAQMAQYALDLLKLKNAHMENCPLCRSVNHD